MLKCERNRSYTASKGDYPYHEGKHLILVSELFAYADESGTHGAEFCAMAGFVASPRQWKKFRQEWRATLTDYGVPAFHATDFFARTGWQSSTSPYHGWSDARAMEFLQRLLRVYSAHRLNPTNSTVNVSDFNAMSKGVRRWATGALVEWTVRGPEDFSTKLIESGKPSAPWFAAFPDFIIRALTHAPDGCQVHFTFDRQNEYASLAHQVWNRMIKIKSSGYEKMGSLIFAPADDHEPLQVADLYANVLSYWLPRKDEDLTTDRLLALAILGHRDRRTYIFDAAADERMMARLLKDGLKTIELHYRDGE